MAYDPLAPYVPLGTVFTTDHVAHLDNGIIGARAYTDEKVAEAAAGDVDLTGYATDAELTTAAAQAVTDANTYTDTQVSSIDVGVTSVNGMTGAVTVADPDLTGYATKTYADQAEADAVTDANTYTDQQVGAIDVGVTTVNGMTGDVTLESLKGDTGDSAYEVWLTGGNTGTVDDYLADIEGPVGPPGDFEPHPTLEGVSVVAPSKTDTGWRSIGVYANGATAGTLWVRRVGHRVTTRWQNVVLVQGSGQIAFGLLPAGFRAPPVAIMGSCLAGGNRASLHFLQAENNGLAWIIKSDGTSTRPSATLMGEMTWITNDTMPTTLPGTPA